MNAGMGMGGWNDSMTLTGIVPPHGWDVQNGAGVEVSPRTVIGLGVVQRCLEVLQNSFFEMGPPMVYKNSYDKDGHAYPVYITPQKKNYPSLFSGSPWGTNVFADNTPVPYNIGIGKTVASMGFFGEAWWYCTERDSNGSMKNLEVLHPAFLDIGKREKGKPWIIKYGWGANQTVINPTDLVHIPRLILPGDQRAINPVQTESAMFAIALAAMQYSQTWFSQGASPGFILSTDNKMDPDAVERIWTKMVVQHSGLAKANLPMMFDNGLKPVMTQVDPERSQMNTTLEFAREEIGGYFGIPAGLLGIPNGSGGVWGKGLQEQNYALLIFTLSGYRVPIDEAYSAIIPRGIQVQTAGKNLLDVNELEQAQAAMARRTAAVTSPNEERRRSDLPPAPNGDDIETPLNSNRNVAPSDQADVAHDFGGSGSGGQQAPQQTQGGSGFSQ